MLIYHEADPSNVSDLLTKGLKRAATGSKSDELILKTDDFLDACLPKELAELGVSRGKVVYGYYAEDDCIADITTGEVVPVMTFVQRSKQAVLAIDADPDNCYISDIDAYDAVKKAVQDNVPEQNLKVLAIKLLVQNNSCQQI